MSEHPVPGSPEHPAVALAVIHIEVMPALIGVGIAIDEDILRIDLFTILILVKPLGIIPRGIGIGYRARGPVGRRAFSGFFVEVPVCRAIRVSGYECTATLTMRDASGRAALRAEVALRSAAT